MEQFVIALLNILMEPIQLPHKVSSYGLLENHKTANWSLRQGDEEVKKETNIVIFLLAPEESLCSNRNIGQICLNIYFFCFILWFTSSSPWRKDQFAFLWFSTSYYCTDAGLQLRDTVPLNSLSLWPCWYFMLQSPKQIMAPGSDNQERIMKQRGKHSV